MAPPCSIGSTTAPRAPPTPAPFSTAGLPTPPGSAAPAAISKRSSRACRTRSACCTRCAETEAARSAVRNESRDVAHFAARLDFGLAVEVELSQRIAEHLAPFLDTVADQVLHDRVGMMRDRTKRQSAQSPHQLLELAGDAS